MKMSILFLALAVAMTACSSTPSSEETARTTGSPKDPVVDETFAKEVKEEQEVGRLMAAKLLGYFGSYEKDPAALKYVNLVGQTLASQIGRPELVYRFGILDTNEINAFATPGGYVFVTKGLLATLKTESELAHVLGHEIAHINAKHMYNEIRTKRDVSAGETVTRLLSRGQSDIGANIAKMVDEGLKKLLEKGLGKEKEYEADATGSMYIATLGYDPTALVGLLNRRETDKKNLKISKTHPPYKERTDKLKKFLVDNGLKGPETADVGALEKRFQASLGDVQAHTTADREN